MIVIPAIDLFGMKAVRMEMGKKEKIVLEFDNPIELAKYWYLKGAKALHVVDLQSAIDNNDENKEIIKRIIKEIDIPVEVGGGFRSYEKVKMALDWGVWRVIVSSILVEDINFLKRIFCEFKEKVIPSLDWKEGKIGIKGWKNFIEWEDIKEKFEILNIKEVIFTDISRDGTLKGIDISHINKFLNLNDWDIWVAGGISSIDDVIKIKELAEKTGRIKGIIVGRALLEGRLDWEEVNQIINAR